MTDLPPGVVRLDDGSRWATVAVVARLLRVREDLVRTKWHHRGRVRGQVLDGRLWVCLDEAEDCELALRRHGPRPGRPRRTA